MMKRFMDIVVAVIIVIVFTKLLFATENADVIVAKDGSGDFTTIQEAINSIPANNDALKIILIKNGVYVEKLIIETNFIALVGEDRDSTRIEYDQPYDFDSTYTDGRAIINIFANDITIANLTAENTQQNTGIHAFTIYGSNNTRTIVINCNILSNGGDTMALWNGETGMYYHNMIYLKGAVDFLCPRGWSYAENIDFYCTRKTTPLWHDGSKNINQKSVIKNGSFDGATDFNLGRNHHDGAFYLLNCLFLEKMLDSPFIRPESSAEPYKWGRRAYFNNCVRPAGNYDWHIDNMITAEGSPKPEEVTPAWTFGGAWDPETTMPSVLPMAFLPKPDNGQIRVSCTTQFTWIPGRNAISHKVYFGPDNPPEFVAEVKGRSYNPGLLLPNTDYYWQIDEVTDNGEIQGAVWQFHTQKDQLPAKASQPFPADQAVDVEGPIQRILWHADSLDTDLHELYWGEDPDSLNLVSSYSVPGYYPESLILGRFYYWRVDLVNTIGTIQGDLWQFSMRQSEYSKADYYQDSGSDGLVSIEVENYTDNVSKSDHTWTLITDPDGYSGEGAMQALPDDGGFFISGYGENGARLDYAVDFNQSGTHYIWIRAYTNGVSDNIFHMGLNGHEDRSAYLIGNFQNIKQWEWLNGSFSQTPEVRTFDVNLLGIQRISLWFGRDGAIADKIVLTTNPDYGPTGLGPDQTMGVTIPKKKMVPQKIDLMQNFPNPFNPSTTIKYALSTDSHVKMIVYDLAGRQVETLVNGHQEAGHHSVLWNIKESSPLPSGLYYVQLKVSSSVKTIKSLVIR